MNLNRFPPTNLFEADGSIDTDDKFHLLALYSGFVSALTPCAQSLTALMESRGLGLTSLITSTLGLESAITTTSGLTTSFTTTKGVDSIIDGTTLGLGAKVCE